MLALKQRLLPIILVLFIVVGMLPFPAAKAAPTENGLTDGEYSVDYSIWSFSSAKAHKKDTYFDKPAKLLVKNGKSTLFLPINDKSQVSRLDLVTGDEDKTQTAKAPESAGSATWTAQLELPADLSNFLTPLKADNLWKLKVDELATRLKINTITPVQAGSELADGEYTLPYMIYEDNTDKQSVMYTYVDPDSGRLTVRGGKKFVSFVLKQSKEIIGFKTEQGGVLTDAVTLSEDTAANTRRVQFEVSDLSARLNGWVKIYWDLSEAMGFPYIYDNEYNVDLGFDAANVKPVDKSEYDINFTALHATKEQASSMDKYFVKPARLTVEGDKKKISFTVTDSTIVTSLKVEQNGALTETTVVSTDSAANTRVIEFEAADLSAILNAQVHISTLMPNGTPYEMDHAIRLKVEHNQAKLTGPASATLGQPINLTFSVNGVTSSVYQQVYRHDLTVLFNPNELDYVSVSPVAGNLATANTVPASGQLRVTTQASGNIAANGDILSFQFKPKSVTQETYVWMKDIELSSTGGKVSIAGGSYKVGIGTDKSALQTLIVEAQNAYDAASEGTQVGQYPVGPKNTLLIAINHARTVADDATAVQTQIQAETSALQAALASFKASVIVTQPGNPGSGELADGEYSLGVAALKDGTTELSVMDGYTEKPAKLQVTNGKKYVYLTLNNSDWIKTFRVERNGAYVDAEVVSENTASEDASKRYLRTVRFEVSELPTTLNIYTHVVVDTIPGFNYDNWYTVQYKFDSVTKPGNPGSGEPGKDTLDDGDYTFSLSAQATDGSTEAFDTYALTDGTLKVTNGKKLATLKLKSGVSLLKITEVLKNGSTKEVTPLYAAKQSAMVRILSSDTEEDSGVTKVQFEVDELSAAYLIELSAMQADQSVLRTYQVSLQNILPASDLPATPPVTNPSGLESGTYNVNFTILKYGTTQRSVMQDYVNSPATLTVDGSDMYISFTLKQSKEITSFKVEQGGSLTETSVVGTDETNNTRDVQFSVGDLSALLNGWVKVDWPAFNYFHEYDVQISFDKSSVRPVGSTTGTTSAAEKSIEKLLESGQSVDFSILGQDNQVSPIDAFVKHPAVLIVLNNVKYVYFTLSGSDKITSFKVDHNGKLEEASLVGKFKESNERVVKFPVNDIPSVLHAELETSLLHGYSSTFALNIQLGDAVPVKQPEQSAQPTTPAESASSLQDLQGHWAKDAIEQALRLGIVNGYEDGTFRPDGMVSRAEFTAMISRALKLEDKEVVLSFADADHIPSWVKPKVARAVDAGIVNSYEDGTFRADRKISRAEVAVMAARALQLSIDETAKPAFGDAGEIPQWAQAYVAAAVQHGIISGRDGNLFSPNDSATRAEAVTLILALSRSGQ